MTGLRYLVAINGVSLTVVEAIAFVVFLGVLINGVIGDARDWFGEVRKRRARARERRLSIGRRVQIVQASLGRARSPLDECERILRTPYRGTRND